MKSRTKVIGLFAALVAAACGTGASETLERGQPEASSSGNHGGGALGVVERLGGRARNARGEMDYVARFTTNTAARAHAAKLMERGGRARVLADGRTVHVRAEAERIADVKVEGGTVAPNVPVRVTPPAPETAAAASSPYGLDGAALDNLLTARSITGVDALAARFPEADGRHAKVAIFDTGIDFELPGVSDGRKLEAFVDRTGFGSVEPEPVVAAAAVGAFEVGGRTLTLGASIRPVAVSGAGVLDEAAQARRSLMNAFDFNRNGSSTDVFPFLVGTNADGEPAVWIDLDGNGSIDDRAKEELTDFNTTGITRNAAASPGRAPLAVTLRTKRAFVPEASVQFHSLASSSSHGSSCATIVAGDGFAGGRLRGMAPKARLLSYLLDPSGQDVYTMAELMDMFLDARDRGVDGISISYGFARGDLAAARFLADFLDEEIASAGIVLGLAAGNEGPGLRSAAADDYVPHHGFAVGAHVSPLLARNVYGWTGSFEENVVHFSSVGPTEGGRAVPDLVSPFMNLARGRTGSRVSPFGGTSSATPAFVGSAAALVSALKATEPLPLSARLLKLALTSAARPVRGVAALTQGAGLVDVAAAYDVYKRLAAEERAAAADPAKRSPYALDLRATFGDESTGEVATEGVVLHAPVSGASFLLSATPATAARRDFVAAPEPLLFEHTGAFLTVPDAVLMARSTIAVAVRFDATKLTAPGVYSDVIVVRRAADRLPLVRVPVVVLVDAKIAPGAAANIDTTLRPDEPFRMPIVLDRPGAVRFTGIAMSGASAGTSFSVGASIYDQNGGAVRFASAQSDGRIAPLEGTSGMLPAGHYEVVLVQYGNGSASFRRDLRIVGALTPAPLRVEAVRSDAGSVDVAVRADDAVAFDDVELRLEGVRVHTKLARTTVEGRDGFAGTLALPHVPGESQSFRVLVEQDAFDALFARTLAVETTFFTPGRAAVLDRVWIPVLPPASPFGGAFASAVDLGAVQGAVDVFAYPNIVDWASYPVTSLTVTAGVPLAEPIVAKTMTSLPSSAAMGGLVRFTFATTALPRAYGEVVLKNAGMPIATVPVELP